MDFVFLLKLMLTMTTVPCYQDFTRQDFSARQSG